jgi:ubiquitin-like protein 4
LSFSLTVQPTDTISHIKTLLADQHPKAPDPSIQRLLLKGKVLSDTKLLKEYEFTPDTVFTLMTKPGSTWTGEERKQQSSPGDVMMSEPEQMVKGAPPLVAPIPQHTGRLSALSHTRSRSGAADELPIPSVVLSPTPTPSDNQLQGSPRSLTLEMDINANSEPHRPHSPNSYLGVVTSPEFWERLLRFLGSEFKTEEDSKEAWEAFFLASKGYMRAHEIAKVRDHVGVVGMGGR